MNRRLIRAVSLSALLWITLPYDVSAQPAAAPVIRFPAVLHFSKHQGLQVNMVGPNSCPVAVSFLDSQGLPIETISINYTQVAISHVQLTSSGKQSGGQSAGQSEVQVVVSPDVSGGSCPLNVSLEIFATQKGATSAVVPPLPPIPPGPPLFTFGPIGATGGETVRLSLAAYPPGPCVGTLGFLDENGNPVGATKTVNLAQGTADFVDVVFAPGPPQRNEVLPLFTPVVGAASGCVASVQVFDTSSGQTSVFYPPGP